MEIASSPTSSASSDESGATGGRVLTRSQLNQAMSNVVEYFQSDNKDKFNVTLNLKEVDVSPMTHC